MAGPPILGQDGGMSEIERQRKVFVDFMLFPLHSDDPDRDGLTTSLEELFDSCLQDGQTRWVNNIQKILQRRGNIQVFVTRAEALLKDFDDEFANAPPNRERSMAWWRYLDALRAVIQAYLKLESNLETMQGNARKYGWGPDVVTLFEMQLAGASQDRNGYEQMLLAAEARPGLNPRKVPAADHDGVRRNMKASRVREGLMTGRIPVEPLDGDWLFARMLGGGMAQAALFVCINDAGVITHRVVRKDTSVEAQSWADATRWHGDMRDPHHPPLEYHCQNVLHQLPESKHVLGVHGYETDIEHWLYKLYLPYCPYGDLNNLIERYKGYRLLPEHFLWYVFGALAQAGLLMEHGGLHEPETEWQEIVHRDLKPGNIFLDLPSGGSYPRYPVPKLADFGLAFQTTSDDALNPWLWNAWAGTRGYMPPEQLQFMDSQSRDPVDAFQLLAHTNVWGVGAIMWSLLHLAILMPEHQLPYFATDGQSDLKFDLRVNSQLKDYFSDELIHLVDACLRFDPKERITFRQIADHAEKFAATSGGGENLGEYIRMARAGRQEEDEEMDLIGLEDNDYAIGFTVNKVPVDFDRLRLGSGS